LCLSLYLKTNRDRYYDLLQRVFFLEGTEVTARSAAEAATQILSLFANDRDRIHKLERAASSARRVHEYMPPGRHRRFGGCTPAIVPTLTGALNHLVRFGIAKEVAGKRRARLFGYSRYLKILSEGTDPIQR
jgi:hypothetical protein